MKSMKSNPNITNCPRCEAGIGESCLRPAKVGHMRRAAPAHRNRLALARETVRLRLIIERRQAGYLWGQKHFFTPRLLGPVFGDGKQLIRMTSINTRPAFWVVRIDSSWNLGNTDNPPVLRDHLEDIYQAM